MKNKVLSIILGCSIVFGMNVTMSSAAISRDWQNAIEMDSLVKTGTLSSATPENWYKFTTTAANETCAISVYNEPFETHTYSAELRYQATADARPIILENTMWLGTRAQIHRVLENVGTYYVRVYSLTGEYSTDTYSLRVSHGRNGANTSVTRVNADGQNYDWAACAEMVGKKYYKTIFGTDLTTRNYKNAARFVQSNGQDDRANSATDVRKSIADTALAANYIFAGDYLSDPIFAVTNELHTPDDFEKEIWYSNKFKDPQPIIIRMADVESSSDRHAQYLVVCGYSPANTSVNAIDPDTSSDVYIDTTELTLLYDEYYEYQNDAVVLTR